MTLARVLSQALELGAGLCRPNAARFVATRRRDHVTLRVERDLTDFVLVALKDCRAGSRKDVIHSSIAIGTRSRQFISSLIEAGVEDFVCVSAEFFNALTCANIPEPRRPINGPSEAVVSSEVELAA